MGADKRPADLTNSVSAADLKTLLSTILMVVDDPSFGTADVKKLLLNTLLSSDVVADNTDIDYLALTPKGFRDSEATDARTGVVKLATQALINGKAGSTVLSCGQIDNLGIALSTELFRITTANKATYFGGASTIAIDQCDISVRQFGKLIFITGWLTGSVANLATTTIILLNFPTRAITNGCAIAGAATNNLQTVPVGMYLQSWGANPNALRISSHGNLNGAVNIAFGGYYLTT